MSVLSGFMHRAIYPQDQNAVLVWLMEFNLFLVGRRVRKEEFFFLGHIFSQLFNKSPFDLTLTFNISDWTHLDSNASLPTLRETKEARYLTLRAEDSYL